MRDGVDDDHAVDGRVELAHGVEYLRDRLGVQHVEVERLRVDGALGDLLAVEGGAVFGVAEGDAFAGVASQALGDMEAGKSFSAAGRTVKGHFQRGLEGLGFLEGCHERVPLVRVREEFRVKSEAPARGAPQYGRLPGRSTRCSPGEPTGSDLEEPGLLALHLDLAQDGGAQRGVGRLAARRHPVALAGHRADHFLAAHRRVCLRQNSWRGGIQAAAELFLLPA